MAIRHVSVKLSAQATSAQKTRILTLALQNVTDFSGYTSDPYIGSWISAGNTVTVTAAGDNMAAAVVQDTTTVSTTVKSVLTVGNFTFFVVGATTGNNCSVAPSLIGPSDTNYSTSVMTGLEFHYTIGDSFFAGYDAASFTVGPQTSKFQCIYNGDMLVFTVASVVTTVGTVAAYSSLGIQRRDTVSGAYRAVNVITNFGANPLIPYQYLDPVSRILVKPVLKFGMFDEITDEIIDISNIHNVLITAYDLFANNGNDYSRSIMNGGTTYLAVGNFVFAT